MWAANMHDFKIRYERFLNQLQAHRLEGFLVSHPPNLAYLFNFTGSTGLACCLEGETQLLVDSRYIEQARSEVRNAHPLLVRNDFTESLQTLFRCSKLSRIGLEAKRTYWEFVLQLQSLSTFIEWVPTMDLVEHLRLRKTRSELDILRRAFEIARKAYRETAESIAAGKSEFELAGILEFELRKAGGEGLSFETIVASGARSSLPHGLASCKKLSRGELVLIDFGVRYRNYHSDLTRIHCLSPAQRPDVYFIVLEAQQRALEKVRPGILTSEVDDAARQVITKKGYGDYFGHSVGHGLGLEVHEAPAISPRRPRELQEGMVFTIEPGIYLPNRYGVRIEDAVVVTRDGYERLYV